ncbi:MAG TPA: DUF1552 domain-containing protein [Polyangiaceae bacterium]|nr:DUF1552 domain-containing protein [Polyangiaceae bacterium]
MTTTKSIDNLLRIGRRSLFAGAGAIGAAGFARPSPAEAQPSPFPRRLLVIHRPCGTYPPSFWPSGGTDDWTPSPILAPFAPLRNDMVVLKGVACPRQQHWLGNKPGAGMIAMMSPPPRADPGDTHVWPSLPGYTVMQQNDPNGRFITASDRTIDQLFVENIAGLKGAIASIQLAASIDSTDVNHDSCTRVISYTKLPSASYATPLWPEGRPIAALGAMVGALAQTSLAAIAKRALNKSIVDFVSADLSKLKARAPRSQWMKIDRHLDAMRSLERDFSGIQCAPPELPPLPQGEAGVNQNDAEHREVCRQQALIIKTAFACDVTRVISYTYAQAESDLRFRDILPQGTFGNAEGHYAISHKIGSNPSQAIEAIETYYAEQTASLLLALKNTPEGNGTVLDNTLVVYWNNCSEGSTHDTRDIPILLFGGKFLRLNGGKFLTFKDRYMSDFWVQTAKAWGYGELTQYGAPQWNRGSMPGIYG